MQSATAAAAWGLSWESGQAKVSKAVPVAWDRVVRFLWAEEDVQWLIRASSIANEGAEIHWKSHYANDNEQTSQMMSTVNAS